MLDVARECRPLPEQITGGLADAQLGSVPRAKRQCQRVKPRKLRPKRAARSRARALNRKINPTRVPIEEKESLRRLLNLQHPTALLGEPDRCVHINDRESDIYELFCAARDTGSHFLIRSCANRRAGDGSTRLEREMDEVRIKGAQRIEVRDRQVRFGTAVSSDASAAPVAKQKQYSPVEATVVYAQEQGAPKDRDRIDR